MILIIIILKRRMQKSINLYFEDNILIIIIKIYIKNNNI
jgi:hypothetical protein